MSREAKYVYYFGDNKAEGSAVMKETLGGKGANLAEMVNLGFPVPPGFTVTTDVCTYYYANDRNYPPELGDQVKSALQKVEKAMGIKFNDPDYPLLLSVRSGARASMPGMMDTVLNLGLTDKTVEALANRSGSQRFAYDCYRRFIQMYGDVVMGLKPEGHEEDPFEVLIEGMKEKLGIENDVDLSGDNLKELTVKFKKLIKDRLGREFPQDPWEQLWGSVGAVFNSWMNERANTYRRLNDIPAEWGTAVNIQAMVFGNMGDNCGTGVAFTRDPASGEDVFFGEYLMNAQGEDVVAGTRTPLPISTRQATGTSHKPLEEVMPDVYQQLEDIRARLEKHFRDMQDIEFTIQDRKLWMLQTRTGKRTGVAALRIAAEMVEDGLITKEEALLRIEPNQLNQLLQPVFDDIKKNEVLSDPDNLLAKGLNAGPGAATGVVTFNSNEAAELASQKTPVILVRVETSPEDIKGMNASQGILTARGGMTSHAALVARQMGKVCVAGCGSLQISYAKGEMKANGQVIKAGDWISIDGTTGEVIKGRIPTRPSEVRRVLAGEMAASESADFGIYDRLMQWADEIRALKIRTNADTPRQAKQAVQFGAQGIGLCRTEHMFFEGDRITSVRKMITANDEKGRRDALSELEPLQKDDFIGIFEAMEDRPVTIRLLDPPLHEFVPHTDQEIEDLAGRVGVSFEDLKIKVESLSESNPMLGHRGCRLGITYPEVYEMQVRAIGEAAADLAKRGIKVEPEIMIPLVGHPNELKRLRSMSEKVLAEVMKAAGVEFNYTIGTMIELPRACVVADQIAVHADFFSFGTNDLTQTTFGLSRDDAGTFLPFYVAEDLLPADPFETIDQAGVGELMKMAVTRGRSTRSSIKLGICGEHGGEPRSVEFCSRIGLDYVSCSPLRVPIARMAAAQAVLRDRKGA